MRSSRTRALRGASARSTSCQTWAASRAHDQTFTCVGAQLSASADELAVSMASIGCSSDIQRQLDEAGVDTACHDGLCSARRGTASSGGWIALVGIATLIGRRQLRP